MIFERSWLVNSIKYLLSSLFKTYLEKQFTMKFYDARPRQSVLNIF